MRSAYVTWMMALGLAQIVAGVASAQDPERMEALQSRRFAMTDEVFAPLDAQRFEPDGCIFEVSRRARRDRIEIRTLIDWDLEHSRDRFGVGAGAVGPALDDVWLLPLVVVACEIRMLAVDPDDPGRGAIVPLPLGRAEVLPLVRAAPAAQLASAPWSRVMEGCVDGRAPRCVVYGTWREVWLATDPRGWSTQPRVARTGHDASDGSSRHPSTVTVRRGHFEVTVPGPLWQSWGIVATLADARTGRVLQHLDEDVVGPPPLLDGAHAQAVAVLHEGQLLTGAMLGGELLLVFDEGAARWARIVGPPDGEGGRPWSLLWTLRACAARPPAAGLCASPLRAAMDD